MPASQSNSFWADRSVLVTGCAGFLGTWITRTLVSAGASVTGIIHRELEEPSLFLQFGLQKAIRCRPGSVLDLSFVNEVLQDDFAVVIHAAAQAFMPRGRSIPHQTFEVNVRGTWNLMEAIRLGGHHSPVVLCSSDCVYGEADGNLCTEETPLRGAGPYEMSKICAEQVAQSYSRTFEIPLGIARFSNLYGAGDRELSRIVPGTIRSILAGEAPVIRSNGRAIRDYLYVEDAADGLACLGAAVISGNSGCFNFSSERPLSVIEMVNSILGTASNSTLRPQIMDQKSTLVSRKDISSARARQQLGWTAPTSLHEGLQRTFNWHRDCWPVTQRIA